MVILGGDKVNISVPNINNYTIVGNYHLRDSNLSLKAKGLLTILMSYPDNWNCTVEDLTRISSDGESAINSAIKELKDFGYLQIDKIMPDKTKSGRIEYVYNVKNPSCIQSEAEQKFYIGSFKCKYTSMLYHFLRSNLGNDNNKMIRVSVENFRKIVGLSTTPQYAGAKYPMFKDMRVHILDPSINEINQYAEIRVSYKAIKTSRKVTGFEFNVETKEYGR